MSTIPLAPPRTHTTTPPSHLAWVRAGLVGLPLYGVLTLWAARDPQPNPDTEYEAWSRFVTDPQYLLTHVLGSGLGLVFAIFGTFALGVYLTRTRSARLGLSAMAVAAFGQSIFLFFTGFSAFGPPVEGRAYLAGLDLSTVPAGAVEDAVTLVMLVAIVVTFVGNVLLGVAVWRSSSLPRGAGALWVLAALLMYPFGVVLGAMTTGATPSTVPAGAALVAVSGAWILTHAIRRSDPVHH